MVPFVLEFFLGFGQKFFDCLRKKNQQIFKHCHILCISDNSLIPCFRQMHNKISNLWYGILTDQTFKSIQKFFQRAKPFNTEVHLLIKYNCQSTQWYVLNTISVLRACMVQAEVHKRHTDQINSEIQLIDYGMVTQDVYCFRAQWLIKDQHR